MWEMAVFFGMNLAKTWSLPAKNALWKSVFRVIEVREQANIRRGPSKSWRPAENPPFDYKFAKRPGALQMVIDLDFCQKRARLLPLIGLNSLIRNIKLYCIVKKCDK